MRTGITCGTVLLTLALLGAGGGPLSHEAGLKAMLAPQAQGSRGLKGVVGWASAEASRPELKKAALRLRDLRKKAREMKQPSKAEKDRLEKLYRDKLDDTLKKLRSESIRVKGIPGGAEAVR